MASCTQIANLFQAWIDEELGDAERVILDQHLAECKACKHLALKHQRVAALLFESFGEQRLRRDLCPTILENLPAMEPVRFNVRPDTGRRDHTPQDVSWAHRFLIVAASVLFMTAVVLYFQWPPDPRTTSQGAVGVVTHCVGVVKQGAGALLSLSNASTSDYIRNGQKFQTGPHSKLMLNLRGPTLVKVNENTRMSVGDDRIVHLEQGQVWLRVAKEDRQFKVVTPIGDITVLGTTFDVIVQGAKAVITVHEGVVQVSNGLEMVRVEPGQQVEMVAHQQIEAARQVDAKEVSHWADPINPDTRADIVFSQTVQMQDSAQLAAEQVFVVVTSNAAGQRSISSFELAWESGKAQADAAYCGYFVHIYNDRMEELFCEHVDGSLFKNSETSSVSIEVPGGPISGVNVIHIKVVPDFSTGDLKTSFNRISAMGA